MNHRTMHATRRLGLVLVVALTVVVGACRGDTGAQGPEGPEGPPGEPGQPPTGEIEPEPFGLVGRISEPNGTVVPGGTVYLVPATAVEALSATPIDLSASPEDTAALSNDEPIEDLIDDNGGSYEQAPVDESGEYRFETLPEGNHFVVWFPAADDARHLPGGNNARVSFSTASLIGMQMNIRVSAQPSAEATYVGSSTCMVCHGLQSTTRTAHMVGLQVPGIRSIMQDVEPWPNFDDGLAKFEAGTELYYFDCEPSTMNPSKCSVDELSSGTARFQINLRRDSSKALGEIGAYYIEMVKGVTTVRYEVVLTYGGALGKQQYLMRRPAADGSWSYFVLPLQYNYRGDFDNDSPEDWPWRDYRSDLWYDFGADALIDRNVPPMDDASFNHESFDNNCAGCHFTGYRLQGSDADGWSASAIVDPGGAFDYDGDGRNELINTGCEACHGPGSEHLELSPRGSHIVSPGLLVPGRQASICGSCHSRPIGRGGGETGLPLSLDSQMPPPGIRRAEFALQHTTRVSGTEDDFFSSGDAAAHYQQYSDHIRSRHYRNPDRISSCTGCHSPHASFGDVYGADVEENLNVVCTVCHSEMVPVIEHVVQAVGPAHGSIQREFRCTECHMVPTAKSGASVPALLDDMPPLQYFWNDISSHLMRVTGRDAYAEQPVAATNQCGAPCHRGFFPN